MTCCGNVEVFLDLGLSPIADAYTATADEPVERFPLRVGVCDKCRLAQLVDVDVDAGFGSAYSFRSSESPMVRAYHRAYAEMVHARHPELVAAGVVEVGCNDGDLLQHFPGAIGVDPSGPAQGARERGLDVMVRPFGLAAAHEICDRRGRQGLVIANHVLAHVPDLGDVLSGIHLLLEDDGLAIVEVQYLPDLLVNNAFDLVYHEHRRYFSLTSLEHYAHRHGLYVVDTELTDRQGGSLRATLGRIDAVMIASDDRVRWLRIGENQWLIDGYVGMQGRAERIRTRLLDLLDRQKGITAVYGAPAKATTLLNFCGLTAEDLPWCVDDGLAKRGRHIPGTGIPIVGPDHMGAAAYLLTVHNYLGDLIRRNPGRRWIVPIPAPVRL